MTSTLCLPISSLAVEDYSYKIDTDSKVFFEEKFLDYLKAKYNVKDDIPSEDYDYDELYDYKNSDGETEWVLVSANYFPAGALDIWFKMEIADRVITSNSVYSPFRFCYGVYDVQSDMFVDLYDLRNTPGKFYGLTDALAELNIGDLIEKTTSFPEETALTSPTKSTETEPTESETTEPTTEIVEPTNEPTNKSVEPTTERFEPTITELDESSITESTEPTTAKVTAKRENPVKITTKTKTVKAKKLKSKKQTVKPLTITKAKGPIKVTLVKSGTTKKIRTKVTVSKKGVITLKKGKYKKDTYKVKLKIIVKGNSNFNPKTLIKTVTVKVK